MSKLLRRLARRVHYNAKENNLANELNKKLKEAELIHGPLFNLEGLRVYVNALNPDEAGLDDRKFLFENILIFLSRLDSSTISQQIEELVITILYQNLPRLPVSYLSGFGIQRATTPTVPATKNDALVTYAFRAADGSNCSHLNLSLGKAGSPFARFISAIKSTPNRIQPDAGALFDTLLRRKKFVPHPGGISSLFFAFMNLVTHCMFNADPKNPNINATSSYLDLSILYGNSEEETSQVRRKDGTGKLWDDVFADGRLLFMPPAACALLVLLSRNHNYIAGKLLSLNESGTFSNALTDEDRLIQDDEIFHRTRLVNCGFFMNIILGDYVGIMLGLVRDGSSWRLDPLMHTRELNKISPGGEGNVVSIELNCLYRWHATLSENDSEWTRFMLKSFMPDKEPEEMTKQDYLKAVRPKLVPDPDLKTWTFGGLKRQANGRFKDEDLAQIIQSATEGPAASFASGVPAVLRAVEIINIEQSRAWETCSLNEFRKFIGLRPYKTFEEWNPDPSVSAAAASLYKNVNDLELYVGLQAEECKPSLAGVGLCPGYTTSRAILSDVVRLTRGDIFFTTHFTPYNLTQWGYDDCQSDKENGSYGGLITKLLFRTLPDQYPAGSTYAHFPFLLPSYIRTSFSKLGLVNQYNWDRPHYQTQPIVVTTYEGVRSVLNDPLFISTYDDRLFNIVSSALEYPPFDRPAARDELYKGLAKVEEYILSTFEDGLRDDKSLVEYFREEAQGLIQEHSIEPIGGASKRLDIVHGVINLLPVHWICKCILGLPLKTLANQRGTWDPQSTYKKFADICRYIYFNFDPVYDWHLRKNSEAAFKELFEFIAPHLNGSSKDTVRQAEIEGYQGHELLRRLPQIFYDITTDELSTFVIAAVVPTAALFSKAVTHVIDFYLGDDRQQERAEIVRLSETIKSEPESTRSVMVYVREALRHNPPVPGMYYTAVRDTSIPGYPLIKAQERAFVSFIDANRDPEVFGVPDHDIINPPPPFGAGEHGLLSTRFFNLVAPTIIGAALQLENIRRAPGILGKLYKFEEEWRWHGSPNNLYIDVDASISPFPDSLLIEVSLWDSAYNITEII